MTAQALAWLFPLAITLHNLEEGVWLPSWSRRTPMWRPVDAGEFRFALVVLTLLAYLTAFWSTSQGARSVGAYIHAGYMLAMLLNVFVPHLAVTLVTRRLMPGVVTGVLFVAPVTATGLYLALRRGGYITRDDFLLSAPLVVAALLISLPLLFRLGRLVLGRRDVR